MGKRHLLCGILAFVLLFLFIFFLPSLLASTSLGKAFFIQRVEAKLKAKVSIGSMRLTWLGPQVFEAISLSNSQVQGDIERLSSDVPFWALSDLKEAFHLQNGSFSFPLIQGSEIEKVDIALKDHAFTASGQTKRGGFFSSKGSFFSPEDLDLSLEGKAVPTLAFDELVARGEGKKMKGLVYKALGPFADFTAKASLSRGKGEISFELSSDYAKALGHMEANDRSISLLAPLQISLKVSKEFGDALAEALELPSLKGLSSRQPLSLLLSPKGFSFPYAPFSLKELEIGEALLDLGQMEVEKGPALLLLFHFLKRPSQEKDWSLWFTPVHFQVQKGVLHLGRVDALLGKAIHVCLWGDLFLVEDRLELTLGIPADTLGLSFALRRLPETFVLKIPVRGTLEKPELITGPASAKLTAILALEAVPRPKHFFGGFLQAFPQMEEERDVPPPHRPFPWER